MFTGDGSGYFFYPVLHEAGFASQALAVSRDDGMKLTDLWISALVRCAPPANKPLPEELSACRPYLQRELAALGDRVAVVVCLGAIAYGAAAAELGVRPRPRFGHGVEAPAPGGPVLLCSFHPSQQNTFTGKLTEPMLDAVFHRAAELAGLRPPS